MDEFTLIREYFDRASGAGSGVAVGIGDDGAVINVTPGKDVVKVIDTMVEGVHFPAGMNPADIGYRAVAVNLSDIAAMGAVPRWMTLALSMPSASAEWLEGFAEGLFHAATEFDVALVGGDTTYAPQTVVSVQLSGEIEPGRALRRDGARVGDTVYVTGTVGDAAAGLYGLMKGRPVRELVARFARPSARVAYGQALVGVATAAIDVSDGLYGDLRKLLSASGVGAEIDLGKLPVSDALAEHFTAERQRSYALGGGDDYELCFTAASPLPDPGVMRVTAIGTVTGNTDLVCRLDGEIVPFDDSGYRHFQ
ncbi:MAG: thiamine-phosphate kinase [Woeseiaceae bacterium]|nr:thiamine-phosphate kinase [Woeseiaceae bacterium]